MKERIMSFLVYTGVMLLWLDICAMAVRVTLPMNTIMRIYYITAIVIYLIDAAKTNIRTCRKELRAECVARKHQIEESFKADYEAFRKEIHG